MSQQPHSPRTSLLHRPGARRNLALLATCTLLVTGLATGASAAAASATADQRSSSASALAAQNFAAGVYIVTLAEDAAATYRGTVAGYAATAPTAGHQLDARSSAVKKYTGYLAKKQAALASSVGAKAVYNYTHAINGFAAELTPAQATRLASDSAVIAIEADAAQQVQAVPSTDFLGLTGEDGVWNANGGAETAGEGTIIGVIDTGIAPENLSFAGEPLGTVEGDAPYYSSLGQITYDKADGNKYVGTCQVGVGFLLSDCSTKIVGAQFFPIGFALGAGTPLSGEYLSPRDGNMHGSHTASTSAGNFEVPATVGTRDFGTISGMAPAAKIAAYKVCWTGVAMSACFSTDLVAAIDQAVADGVDVLNFSIGGGAATTTVSATGEAFGGAASAGIFVAASAGNSGPGASTLDNAAPWLTTVGASTIPSYEATVQLGNGESYPGASIVVAPDAPLTGPLVTATSVAMTGATTPELCEANELDPAKAAGKIVVCERGVSPRLDKSAEVARAGGIGMVLVNPTPSSLDLDNHVIPTVHVDAQYRERVYGYAETAGATTTLVDGNTTNITSPAPQMAGFSSRGPVLADGSDLLKPDITAPGVAILAAGASEIGGEGTYAFLSGTSMSSPHIAGLALLYFGVHPNATPSEVKSAMMTTAYNTLDATGATVTDPFSQGAGHVDPTRFFSAGLLYLNGSSDWESYKKFNGYSTASDVVAVDSSNLNLASLAIGSLSTKETLTRTVTSTGPGAFEVDIMGMDGVDVTVSPSTMTFDAAGETQKFTVTFDRTTAPNDAWVTGSMNWISDSIVVHSPMAVLPVDAQPESEQSFLPTSPAKSDGAAPYRAGSVQSVWTMP